MKELLVVEDLKKRFPIKKGLLKREVGAIQAVNGVSFELKKGQTLGLVGESGSGKSTLGRCILQLYLPDSGSVQLEGDELVGLGQAQMRARRQRIQMIFQDPLASLNPRMTIREILLEPLEIHGIGDSTEDRLNRVKKTIELCGLSPEQSLSKYPHEFSGGQRQRICIARALVLKAEIIVCDEPVSALDVSIQAQVINLLRDLQREFDLSYLFIAHDLKVVRHISDFVAVMYLGRIVEYAPVDELFLNPIHPYTQALFSSASSALFRQSSDDNKIEGEPPSPARIPSGCSFHPRCRFATEICRKDRPPQVRLSKDHRVECHHTDKTMTPKSL